MTPFTAPKDDILFSLRHVAGARRLADWDDDMAADVLGHFAQLAEGAMAPLNAPGDAKGARLENGRVRMPDGFGAAYSQLAEGGWQGLAAPELFGGMGLSPVIGAGVSEIFSGANHAMQMVCNLVPGAISTLLRFGTEAQQQAWIPRLASGEVLSTMCLTEPEAGSDLSAIRTRARRSGDGWRIDGEKIFISGGDQDMSEDILHLVLARSGDDGLRGLSLFLCPRQAEAHVTRIEEKLGLHASPTCHMAFDGAKAELLGEEGAGLKAMFTLMNHARIDVALQGAAHATRAAHIASAYANERKQGRRPDGSAARLAEHADVRRMLDEQAILAIGARAMCHIALVELELGARPALAHFLTPLCKVYGSEAGIRSADLGIQVLGGYGYLTEYGMDQIWRDARICAIYEGANGIHARSLATRGLRPDGGADEFEDLIAELAKGDPSVTNKLGKWRAARRWMAEVPDPTPYADAFYRKTAELFQKAIWTRSLSAADHHPTPARLKALAQRALHPVELPL
ncbi:MAG: acyl-CoA dehydrogenase family protein [Paracoccaceae bacterium]|nr:acyl-CoA dehydrogenase family protein [Paracoccaceae bacterium]